MNEERWNANVGQALRDERRRRGWTIYDVAALVNRSGAWVSRVERGIEGMKAYDYWRLRLEGLLR